MSEKKREREEREMVRRVEEKLHSANERERVMERE